MLSASVTRCRRVMTMQTLWLLISLPHGRHATGGRSPLELAFESKELRDICENEADARRKLGESIAEALKRRLADLDAATSPKDLLAGRLRRGLEGQTMVIDLCEGHRIVFAANHPDNPATADGDLDWANVRRIRILRIEGDHV
jgi:plasmid maintenance system killer protein